jgi:predicted nucleotidyltransferase
MLLVHVCGFHLPRPTRDVDIGVAVANWEEFERFKTQLTGTGDFSPVPGIVQQLSFKPSQESRGTPLDIVPFGGIREADAALRWPANRERVQVSENLAVPVASLPAQALLKLVAWLERRTETSRDAVDLLMLLRYIERAGAAVLGEDVRAIALPGSYQRLDNAFAAPSVRDALLTHVSSGFAIGDEDRLTRAQTLLDAFFDGFGRP